MTKTAVASDDGENDPEIKMGTLMNQVIKAGGVLNVRSPQGLVRVEYMGTYGTTSGQFTTDLPATLPFPEREAE